MTETETKFTLRLPADVAERVRALAEANLRSVNSEIVHALRQYLKSEEVSA